MNGQHVLCSTCKGSCLVLNDIGEPDNCADCFGGYHWVYPNGTLAKYVGGKLIGSITKKELSYIGSGSGGKSTLMETHYD